MDQLPNGQDCGLANPSDAEEMYAATLLVRERDQGRGKTSREC